MVNGEFELIRNLSYASVGLQNGIPKGVLSATSTVVRDGREFNISLLAGKDGPEVLPPAEIVFVNYDENRPRIIDFKAKWEIDSFEYINTVREFPGKKINNHLATNLKEAALSCWHLFSLKGYARVDVRTDNNDNVFVIEINGNPCISPDGGFVAATKEAGYPFTDVLQRIINDLN